MAIERVELLLKKTVGALEAAGVRYAVVGGNAVAAWVSTRDPDAVRATKDVDLLMRRESLPKATEALLKIGLLPAEVLGVHMFVDRDDPSPKRGVHVVIANEKIRAHYAHPAPDPANAITIAEGFRVIDLASLVAMKLQSFRDVDRTHIRDMLAVGLIDEGARKSLPSDLAQRLTEIETNPEDTN
jgi:D-mannonate dehydratase